MTKTLRNLIYELLSHDAGIVSIEFSQDGKLIASSDEEGKITLWDIETGNELKMLSGSVKDIGQIKISPDIKTLSLKFNNDNNIVLWNPFNAQSPETIQFEGKFWENETSGVFSPQGSFFVTTETGNLESESASLENIKLREAKLGKEIKLFKGKLKNIDAVIFSPDEKFLATINKQNIISLWDLTTGIEKWKFEGETGKIIFLPNGQILANVTDETILRWNLETGKKLPDISMRNDGSDLDLSVISFSPDNFHIALTTFSDELKIWNINNGKRLTIEHNKPTSESGSVWYDSVAFSPNGKILATFSEEGFISADGVASSEKSYNRKIKLWDVISGKLIKSYDFDDPNTAREVFGKVPDIYIKNEYEPITPDGKYQFKPSDDGRLRLYELKTGKLIADLVLLGKNDWIVVAPNGRFDTNKIENPKGLHWLLQETPFVPVSLEVFMRDYYEPNLLPRLLKCNEENTCDQEFKPVRNLTELNRTQPKIKITDIKPTSLLDVVKVSVEAENAASEYQKDKQNQPLHSGVYDVRLFRDGQLVGYSTADEKLQTTFKAYQNFDEELNTWQSANKVELVNGKKTFTFNVKLPKNPNAQEFNFTAYAFNSDRVKSETASRTYKPGKPLPTAKGNAYIITIGVNANENSSYNLRYAANDARRLQDELGKRMPAGKYEKIVQIPLISDYDKDGKITENNATKEKIKAVLDRLSGKTVSDNDLKDVPNREMLKKVEPEDLVLIAFSGHGYADQNGIFYLVPSNIGKSAEGGLNSILPKAISSDELSLWLRDVDAGEMMMIVDACHSAAAVQGKDFKPGPMGSRGLGQLSYDKGMRILTATQADNVALELGSLQQGLLTYSLVKVGLELGQADFQPKDSKLFSSEWLSFAVKDVPELYEKIEKGVIKDLLINGEKAKGVDVVNLEGNQKSNLNLQQPSLFDFSRRDKQYELFGIVAQ